MVVSPAPRASARTLRVHDSDPHNSCGQERIRRRDLAGDPVVRRCRAGKPSSIGPEFSRFATPAPLCEPPTPALIGRLAAELERRPPVATGGGPCPILFGGALPEAELVDILGRIGFDDVRVAERFDAFAGTSKEGTTRRFGVAGINVFAQRRS